MLKKKKKEFFPLKPFKLTGSHSHLCWFDDNKTVIFIGLKSNMSSAI